MRRTALFAALLLLLLPLRHTPARAASPAFSVSLSEGEGKPGDAVEAALFYEGAGEVGAFFVQVEFDPAVFEYVRVGEAAPLREAYSGTLAQEDQISSVYTVKLREECLSSPGETFTYHFRVKEGADPGQAAFSLSVYDAVDPDGQSLGAGESWELPYTVLPPPSGDAALRSLTPAAGELAPPFSPDCFQYALSVPFETAALTFTAEPAEGAVCKVNRKNLGAGGSDTLFLVTVTAEDGKTRNVYRVTVHRGEKPSPTPGPAPSPKPENTPKPKQTPDSSSRVQEEAGASSQAASSSGSSRAEASPWTGPSPKPALAQAGGSSSGSTPSGGGTAAAAPSIQIRNGEASFLPAALTLLGFLLVLFASDPLARWLCGKLPEKGDSKREKPKKKK